MLHILLYARTFRLFGINAFVFSVKKMLHHEHLAHVCDHTPYHIIIKHNIVRIVSKSEQRIIHRTYVRMYENEQMSFNQNEKKKWRIMKQLWIYWNCGTYWTDLFKWKQSFFFLHIYELELIYLRIIFRAIFHMNSSAVVCFVRSNRYSRWHYSIKI